MTDNDSSAPVEPSSRLFLRPIGPDTTKEQIEDLFSSQGPIKEVKLIKNYGFIEFDSLDDAVRAKENVDGQALNGEPLFCTYANPIKVREPRTYRDRNDRNDRGGDRKEDIYRVNISGLAPGVSWQDLKDFGRTADVDVTYTNVSRDREGEGTVEFRSADQMEQAVSKLDGTEFKGEIVTLKIDPNPRPRERRPDRRDGGRGDRGGRDGRDRDGRDRRRDTYMPSRNGDRGDRGDRRGGDRRGGRDGGRGGDRGDRGGDRGDRGDRGPRRDRRGSRGDRDRDDRRGRDDRDDRDRRRDDRDDAPERRRSLSPDARRGGSPPPPPPPPADPVW